MRPVLLPSPVLLLALVPLTAHAQSTPADQTSRAAVATEPAVHDTLIQRVFRIPAQALPDAVHEFIGQSGMQVRAEGEVPPVHSPGVIGRFTAPEALRRLVAGTGFRAEVLDTETLALRPMSGAYELEP